MTKKEWSHLVSIWSNLICTANMKTLQGHNRVPLIINGHAKPYFILQDCLKKRYVQPAIVPQPHDRWWSCSWGGPSAGKEVSKDSATQPKASAPPALWEDWLTPTLPMTQRRPCTTLSWKSMKKSHESTIWHCWILLPHCREMQCALSFCEACFLFTMSWVAKLCLVAVHVWTTQAC